MSVRVPPKRMTSRSTTRCAGSSPPCANSSPKRQGSTEPSPRAFGNSGMAEWRHLTIGELCDSEKAELQTGPFGSQLHAHDYVESGIPVVPTEAIRDRQIDRSVLPRISAEKAAELR